MDPMTVVAMLAGWLISLVALYIVIRLAVTHALRSINKPAPVRKAPGLLPVAPTSSRAAHMDDDAL
ncbi:hypothetical protein [Protaetiibacter larvae]|uniref:Uncharacterized protein n=1 Tax=Protaetiibacter larvae TaxID=2592654 RepID=A0A5C1Y6E0_9MICO|nr:hypothetical protein [Protaetiibacter larvae]QEO08879.1 hypothetical protein FLP23_01890 [Protaetiibacter larvae]